jgi:4-hydroxy-3-polyprenylbenzoate decarboxylase
MPHDSLGDFLSQLEDSGELVRVAAPADAALELAEITRRLSQGREGGPAIIFESVRGSAMPVVTNLLGSHRRLCRALGVRSLDELVTRCESESGPPGGSWLESLTRSPFGKSAANFAPRMIKQGFCQQIVKLGRDVNLWELPIPRSWPDEPHPVITLGQVVMHCPITKRRSVELVPLQVVDPQQVLPCWNRYQRGLRHWIAAESQGQQLPIAIVLGGPAIAPLAALAPLPDAIDPFGFTGALNGAALDVVKCRTIELEAPAHAEMVIEGTIAPGAPRQRPAPLAAPNGFYTEQDEPRPLIQVTAITHRANPIFPSQIVGPPPSEDGWMRLALERLFLPWIQAAAPEIVDWHFPAFGGGRMWLFVSIRKTYPHQARKVLHALWGHPATLQVKNVAIVDETVNVHDDHAVWFRIGTNVDPGRDLEIGGGPPAADDPARSRSGISRKLGLDATAKLPDENESRTWPKELAMSPAIIEQVAGRWAEFKLPKEHRE